MINASTDVPLNAALDGSTEGGGNLELPGIQHQDWAESLAPILKEAGERDYRAKQILDWVFRRHAQAFDGMNNLPRALRQHLDARTTLHPVTVDRHEVSRDCTRKFLWRRSQGGSIESVLIPDDSRRTFCVSTQAGCPVRCTFCATGYGGFDGQLSPGEIVDQVLQMIVETDIEPTNIVFMGMGEPLLNFENVLQSIGVLTHADQLGLSPRRLTVSTVGIPKKMVELADQYPQVKLALSLHAARDDLRDEIIPLNQKYPLSEVLEAAATHQRQTGRYMTFEYIILPGVNDSAQDAGELARRVGSIPSRINLIGFNPFPGAPYERPTVQGLTKFRSQLEEHYPGTVTIRRSRGEDIQGACGQLSLAHDSDRKS
jgi:23S rRNA (adenine2503-C2)-methyltransferase